MHNHKQKQFGGCRLVVAAGRSLWHVCTTCVRCAWSHASPHTATHLPPPDYEPVSGWRPSLATLMRNRRARLSSRPLRWIWLLYIFGRRALSVPRRWLLPRLLGGSSGDCGAAESCGCGAAATTLALARMPAYGLAHAMCLRCG